MKCPFCGFIDTQVKDSRPTEDGISIRRRRFCNDCNSRFTTFERVQLCELTVLKSNGAKVSFDRDKLARSIYVATKKRPVDQDKLERIINSVVRRLESLGESEIPSQVIGEHVMESLETLDTVSYVRFASVYRNFEEVKDFEKFIGALDEADKPAKRSKRNAS